MRSPLRWVACCRTWKPECSEPRAHQWAKQKADAYRRGMQRPERREARVLLRGRLENLLVLRELWRSIEHLAASYGPAL